MNIIILLAVAKKKLIQRGNNIEKKTEQVVEES